MKLFTARGKVLLPLFLLVLHQIFSAEANPLSLASAAFSAIALSVSFVYKDQLSCYFAECCGKQWVDFNHTGFKEALAAKVYGQPLIGRLSEAVQEHWNNRHPAKALVLSLHGPTGTGKNYAVRILADHLFKRGGRSRYFHLFSATVHFPHSRLLDTYADQIHEWVRGNVSLCGKSVFVFDEIDKMPHSLLDVLKPFVDYHEHINGIDYRRAIFIFLSNSGSELIMRRMVELKRSGHDRSDTSNMAKFDHLLSEHVYSDNSSALRSSALLQHHLVSRFIPFLPLERDHVIGCIKDYLKASQPAHTGEKDLIDRVLNELPFVPNDERFFSSAGFKVALDTKVYGQPLVGLANAVWHHWNDKQSAKALVLSLHGPTGTGKNYVARILANHLYTRGTKSNFYRLFHAAVHFPHKSRLETYMSELQEWVRGNVSRCLKSMFVFDEFDKIPHGLALLDALKPFLDHNDHIGGVDYRRAIFIFLRQQPGALLYHSLVSQFIPLLPLEKDHVAGCIDDYLLDNQPDYLIPTCFIDRVLADIDFQPKVERYFASSGCKRVIEKTQVYGQPLTGLAEAIQQHWNDSQAAKALVISMHGPTGTGKNYVCQIMANHLYKEGTRSQFYHLYPATLHFHQSSQLLNYMNRLHSWIRGNVTRCPRSVFVFDEVDKMPFRLLDSLQPLLDYHETDQREHVTGCIEDYMRASQPKYLAAQRRQLFIDRVLKQLRFKPENERFFSESGCKMVISKAQFVQSMTTNDSCSFKLDSVSVNSLSSCSSDLLPHYPRPFSWGCAEGFNNALKERVYGQPLIGLSNAVQQHWSNNQPAKALLLSMHGPPGTGKNYVSGILIRHLFIKDSKSKFYHLFSGTVHFPHKNQVQTYKDQIQAWVRGNVSICPKSVFVFDEVDKMPATLLDALKPFVDSYQHIDRVDYRRAIFIFLSNSGSDMISRYMLAQKKLGKDRSEVYSKLDDKLPLYLYDESNGPLRKSDLLKHHLVSRFIPFLPLERLHVTECIKDYLKLHYPDWLYGSDFIERVLNKLVFVPEREKFFSSTGCKRVADKVQLQMSIDEMSDKDKRRRRNEL
uniref:AAA domain-containing protein n=1 Tax=Macrostomum lignano TaxID=282301 RepID=A0A1I8JH06_9PLAT